MPRLIASTTSVVAFRYPPGNAILGVHTPSEGTGTGAVLSSTICGTNGPTARASSVAADPSAASEKAVRCEEHLKGAERPAAGLVQQLDVSQGTVLVADSVPLGLAHCRRHGE